MDKLRKEAIVAFSLVGVLAVAGTTVAACNADGSSDSGGDGIEVEIDVDHKGHPVKPRKTYSPRTKPTFKAPSRPKPPSFSKPNPPSRSGGGYARR